MIGYEERERVGVVRLNRIERRNALTHAMLDRLGEIFSRASSDASLRAIILTGAGAAFCAGTDIAELSALDETNAREASRRGQAVCDAIEDCTVPVIATVNGAAVGGGCELALACHLRIAARDAFFSLPEAHLGVLPAYGGTQRLARHVGSPRALGVMLAGDEINADEALALGLVNRVVESDELMNAAMNLAAKVRRGAPLAVRACLRAVVEGSRLPFDEGLRLEAELFAELFATEDVREGTRAFLEKRKPEFKGK